MQIKKLQELLEAKVLCGESLLDGEITRAFASDMMSDVLACAKDQPVLVTGLCNPQVIRTAEMLDIECIIFVRGKPLEENIVEMAKDRNMIVLKTEYTMFTTCGLLYEEGVRGVEN